MSDFLSFGGYGFYILSSYVAAGVVIACELLALRQRFLRARRRVDAQALRKGRTP